MGILTITLEPDWRSARSSAGKRTRETTYQGEALNFESAGAFFGKLTARRWALIHALQADGGNVGIRELARLLGSDPSRIHHDSAILINLGLIERNAAGDLGCSYNDIHVGMHLATRVA